MSPGPQVQPKPIVGIQGQTPSMPQPPIYTSRIGDPGFVSPQEETVAPYPNFEPDQTILPPRPPAYTL